MVFCLSIGILESRKPSTICAINWVFLTPTPTTVVLVGSGILGLISELALIEFLKGLIMLWYMCNHFSLFLKILICPSLLLLTWRCQTTSSCLYHPSQTQFYLNMSLLQNHSMMAHIQRVWNLEPRPHHHTGWIEWWHDIISCFARFLCIYGRQLSIYCRWSYDKMTKVLCAATKYLALNPFDSTLQLHLAQLRHQKQVADSHSTRGAQIKARLHWLKVGDRASKESFLALCFHHTSIGIKKIKRGMGSSHRVVWHIASLCPSLWEGVHSAGRFFG